MMDQYIGVKLINAKPMTRGGYSKLRNLEFISDPDSNDDGYLVEYLDGGKQNHPGFENYISWSPKDVFEAAYRKTSGMSFGLAIEAMKLGKKVRLPYFAEDASLKYQFPDKNSKMTDPYIYFQSKFGLRPWTPSHDDMYRDDWSIVS